MGIKYIAELIDTNTTWEQIIKICQSQLNEFKNPLSSPGEL